MKRLICILATIAMMATILAATVFAAPDSSPCIKVTATFEQYTGGICYAGYNINGYDAYNYKFVAGDKIEYEVYLETKAPGLGYLEIQASKVKSVDADGNEVADWKTFRSCVAQDTDGNDCHPGTDLTAVAYQKWYKRTYIVPKTFEGFSSRHWYPMVQKIQTTTPTLPTEPEVFYIRNIHVYNANDQLMLTVFDDKEKFISSTKVEAAGAKMTLTGENQKSAATSSVVSKSSSTAATSAITSSTASQSASNSASSQPPATEKDNTIATLLIIGIIVVILATGVILFFILKKKKE